MQKHAQLSGLMLLRKTLSFTLCAGLSLSLLSTGCDKGDSNDKDANEEKKDTDDKSDTESKDDSDGKKDSDGDGDDDNNDDNNDDSTGDQPADKDQLSEEQMARVTKLCKETCEDDEVRACEPMNFSEKIDDCIKQCENDLSAYFGASEDEVCLDSFEDTYGCLYSIKCDEFPDMSAQVLGLFDKESTFTGECADQFEKSAEHCAEDLKKALGDLPFDPGDLEDPTKPAPTVLDVVVDGTKWTGVEATITKNEKDVHKVVISDKSGLACGEDESTLERAITFSLEGSGTSVTATVHFHYDKQVEIVEQSNVALGPATGDKRVINMQASSDKGDFFAEGAVTAKVCD